MLLVPLEPKPDFWNKCVPSQRRGRSAQSHCYDERQRYDCLRGSLPMGEQVVGHYVSGSEGWQPALQQSTDLFKALVADDLNKFEEQVATVCPGSTWHTVLYWSSTSADSSDAASPKVEAKSRTLAMLAAQHNAVRVLSYLLSRGEASNPKLLSKDGLNCYSFLDYKHDNAATIKGMLDDAAGNWASSDQADSCGPARGNQAAGATDATCSVQDQDELDACMDGGTKDSATYSTSDLTRPEYSTPWFRMYCFKVLRCSKRYAHDWRACPFAHPTENARRRDPQVFTYSSLVCPDYRQGCCVRGDTCQYAHGVFESWLHPSRYRTQLCKDHEKCDRPVCFFAHSVEELRTPENSFVPGPEERLRVPESMQVVLGIAPSATLPQLQVNQPDTAYTADQNHQLELMMQQQQQQQQQGLTAGSSSSIALNRATSSNASIGGSSSQAAAAVTSTGPGDDQQQQASSGDAAAAADAAPSSSSGMNAQPSPKQQQLVSPTAMPMPRMSNAFARKHGLDPKENPLVNLQRLAMQQGNPSAQGMGGAPLGGRRGKRGSGGQHAAMQGYPPQQHFQQPPNYHQQQLPPAHPPPLLQPLTLQQPQQLLQPQVLSPAAAAAYYGNPSPMQQMQHSPASPMLDPQAMALLFGGMGISGPPLSPVDPTAAMAAGMAPAQFQAYAMGAASPTIAISGAGMLSPVGALTPGGGGLGAHSPLPQPMMHPASALHSPQHHF